MSSHLQRKEYQKKNLKKHQKKYQMKNQKRLVVSKKVPQEVSEEESEEELEDVLDESETADLGPHEQYAKFISGKDFRGLRFSKAKSKVHLEEIVYRGGSPDERNRNRQQIEY